MTKRTMAHDGKPFRARTVVPGDKSLSHRALIFAAMASGVSEVKGLGSGADIAASRGAITQLGVDVTGDRIESPGIDRWLAPPERLDAGNSGTTLRLLAGALAGRPFPSTLAGDSSLNRRPMKRLVAPLQALGARVDTSKAGTPPVTVQAPPAGLHGAVVELAIASAQVRSAFSLAALQADGRSQIDSPPGFRDHTERWLASFGLGKTLGPTRYEIIPGRVPPATYDVPGDPSSAAFLWAAAAMLSGAEVTTLRVSVNQGRIGFLAVLQQMGAEVAVAPAGDVHGDPIGDVVVRGGGVLGTDIGGSLTVATLDELPLVAVVASSGAGRTVIRDASELRVKESDRIASTVAMIRALGGVAEEHADGLTVVGTGGLRGGTVDSVGDHRIAMAAAVAATVCSEAVVVTGADAADVSWPGFYDRLEALWSSR